MAPMKKPRRFPVGLVGRGGGLERRFVAGSAVMTKKPLITDAEYEVVDGPSGPRVSLWYAAIRFLIHGAIIWFCAGGAYQAKSPDDAALFVVLAAIQWPMAIVLTRFWNSLRSTVSEEEATALKAHIQRGWRSS